MRWYHRAVPFVDALLAGDWAGTYQSYHPGVTVMWLAGVGMRVFAWRRGLSSDQLLGAYPSQPGTVDGAIAAGVFPMALVIALCISLSYLVLKRFLDQKIALAGSCLLALDPFHVAYGKVLGTNGLLATFMFVSVLFLFSYARRTMWRDLIWAGVFAGLSFLTKTPSLFLIPYTVLVLATHALVALGRRAGARAGWRYWSSHLWGLVRSLLVWVGVAAAVFVVGWPAMWGEPLDVLDRTMEGAFYHVETVHENPVFFNGRVAFGDPGWLFYLATIAWKTTAVTLPLGCVALVFALPWFRRGKHKITMWLLVAYVVFFVIQMGLGDWKQVEYMVPVFPALDTLAAFGLVGIADAIGRATWWRKWRWLSAALILLALAGQACIVLPRHPYYGTHHNTLLGGSKVAQHILPLQIQGEGLDLAAQHLNALPRAYQARAMVFSLGARLFEHVFVGHTSVGPDPWINYRVYYVNQVMRGLGGEKWKDAWNADRQNPPMWSVAFDGVTYVWVYGAPPEIPAAGGPEHRVNYRLGEHIHLRQYRLSSDVMVPGESLTVVLLWTADEEIKENYVVFCHILSADGRLVAQRDGPPVYGVSSTPSWRVGEAIEDSREVFLGDDLAPGEYELSVGMYDPKGMERLPAYDEAGKRLLDDRIVLSSLRIHVPSSPGE
jgi:hypothetical protein